MKLNSLYDLFDNCEIAAVLLTETWIKTSGNNDRIHDDISKNKGLGIINYNRPGRRRGGGVAIVFNTEKLTLQEHKFRRDGIEVVAAKGRIKGQKRAFVIICAYLPPNLLASRVKHAFEIINNEIDHIKTLFESPLIIIGGDFNLFEIKRCHIESPDIVEIDSPATRKNLRLDLMSCNFKEELVTCFTNTPLESDVCPSDHRVLVANFKIKRRHKFSLVTYRTKTNQKV